MADLPASATVPAAPAPIPSAARWRFYLALFILAAVPSSFALLFAVGHYEHLLAAARNGWQLSDTVDERFLQIELVIIYGVILLVFAVGVTVCELFFVAPVRQLLGWLRRARVAGFTVEEANPVLADDEYGVLGKEMHDSVQYFREVEERERQISREKSEFLSVAAHQLRTPLTALRWGIETMASSDTVATDHQKVAEEVKGTVLHMIHLVDDFLNVTKIEEGKFGYEFVVQDIVPTLQKVVEDAQIIAQSRSISLSFEPAAPSIPVYADHERIGMAVSNLVSNALQYTESGGKVLLSVAPEGTAVKIMVTDSGIGMTEEERTHLFMKFSRSVDAMRMRPDGSGLGLYIVKNIIEKHGSTIEVRSQKGTGSSFWFLLPVQRPDEFHPEISIEKFFGGV